MRADRPRISCLDPTASLVMKWAKELYTEGAAGRYMERVDLSAGDKIYAECNDICGWYREVILNRKYMVKKLIQDELSPAGETQIVICGCGQTPLALELLDQCGKRIYRIFEIDKCCLRQKEAIYKSIAARLASKVELVNLDITAGNFLPALENPENGLRDDAKTIVVLEGISYYFTRNDLKNIIGYFSSSKHNNIFIVEYLLPYRCIIKQRRRITQKIFKSVRDSVGIRRLTHYTSCGLADIFRSRGGRVTEHYPMRDIEKKRLGGALYFGDDNSWWIEIVKGIV